MTSSNTLTVSHTHSIRPPYQHFSSEEGEFILANRKDMTLRELSEAMNRPMPSIRYWLDSRGLCAKQSDFPRWEEWQLEVLIKSYGDTHPRDIAVLVGKSPGAVSAKAHKLHLLKDRAFSRKLYQEGARKRIAKGLLPFGGNQQNVSGMHRKPIVITDRQGNIVKVFKLSKDCAKFYNMSNSSVTKACKSTIHYSRQFPELRFWYLKQYNKENNTNIQP